MSRSLRRTAEFNGLKEYEVASLKKEIKNKHNRDRNASKLKHDQQSASLTTNKDNTLVASNEGWDGQFDTALGWS